jgi:hypothetical protein
MGFEQVSRNVWLPCCHVSGSTLGVVITRLSLRRQMYVLCLLKGGLSYDHLRNHLRTHRVLVLSVSIHIYNLIMMQFYKQYEATHPQCMKRYERNGRKAMQKFTWTSMEVPELWGIIGPCHTRDKISGRSLPLIFCIHVRSGPIYWGGGIYLAKKIIRWWYFTCKKPENIICDGILHVNMFH